MHAEAMKDCDVLLMKKYLNEIQVNLTNIFV